MKTVSEPLPLFLSPVSYIEFYFLLISSRMGGYWIPPSCPWFPNTVKLYPHLLMKVFASIKLYPHTKRVKVLQYDPHMTSNTLLVCLSYKTHSVWRMNCGKLKEDAMTIFWIAESQNINCDFGGLVKMKYIFLIDRHCTIPWLSDRLRLVKHRTICNDKWILLDSACNTHWAMY